MLIKLSIYMNNFFADCFNQINVAADFNRNNPEDTDLDTVH